MKTISIHSYKGGTGKTTFLLNLAGVLANKKQKVLAIDYDLRAPSFQSYFEVKEPKSLSSFLLEDEKIESIIYPCKTNNIQLDLIFSSMEFLKQHSKQRDKLSRDDSKFLSRLYQLQQKIQDKYDFCFIDTIPGFFYRAIDAMMVSDIVIVVGTPSTSNILGISELCQNIYAMLREDAKFVLLINKIEEEGLETEKEIFEKNLEELKRLGKNYFDHTIEAPYYNILSERIHIFEKDSHKEFLTKIEELAEII
ncbi:MAG: ParA family protein, partial [Candidatus Heimdallarchaeaceae archaeon]